MDKLDADSCGKLVACPASPSRFIPVSEPPPPSLAAAVTGGPRLLEAGVPEPEGVPPYPARIEGLRIDLVLEPADRAVWNTLVAREHSHGMTTFAGRQVRYLGRILRRRPRVELLVRAKSDRVLGKGRPKLFATMSGGAPDGMLDVEIEGLTVRPKSSRKKARPARTKRLASCELRFRRVTLPATDRVPCAEPIAMSAVHVREVAPPEGEDPVQWFLLTTVEVGSAEDAAEIVGHYLQRWRVEDFFRVLKSGCRVEFLLFRSADRLQRAIAINAVIAWCIMVMTLLGRQVPECEPQLMFTDAEPAFLHDYAARYGLTAPERLGDAVRAVAHPGGYRDRKGNPDPGNQIMWHGQTRLTSAALGHEIGRETGFHPSSVFLTYTIS